MLVNDVTCESLPRAFSSFMKSYITHGQFYVDLLVCNSVSML